MKKLTVNEIIKNEGIVLHKGKINLIVAPAGSGKTYYIFNTLLDPTKKSVYLCDTSNLREATLKDKEFADKVKGTAFMLIEGFNLDKYNCTVMTYAKWFYEMNKREYEDVETIVCDEIHNLYKYKDKFDKDEDKEKGIKESKIYSEVINNLFQNARKGINIVGFTATHKRIKKEMYGLLREDDSNIYNAFNSFWNVINLSNRKDIRRLKEDFTYRYSNYRNLGYHLKAFNGFKVGKKALIYTDRITTALDMKKICNENNLNSIALWSVNNKEHPMDEQQKAVRESILTNGIIPDGIDILIINGSYETGINIKDKNIELVIVNSTDADTQIQARSRVRKDIKALLLKSNNMINDIEVLVPEKYLDIPLSANDKRDLCKELNIYNENTRILKWTSIKSIIINSGYDVNGHTVIRDRKRLRVDTIKEVVL